MSEELVKEAEKRNEKELFILGRIASSLRTLANIDKWRQEELIKVTRKYTKDFDEETKRLEKLRSGHYKIIKVDTASRFELEYSEKENV